MLSLYLLDNTKIKKLIGYEKVKEYIKTDINIFALGKGFFGDGVFEFYNLESAVSQTVYETVKIGDITVVYQTENELYSTFIGSVVKIIKYDDSYSVIISNNYAF